MAWFWRQEEVGQPLLDEGYIGRLEQTLGTPMLTELLADGMIELADRRSRLAALVRDGDGQAIAALAHDLVSVAGHMGLRALSAEAAKLNRALRTGPPGPPGLGAWLAEGLTAPAEEITAVRILELAGPTLGLFQPSLRALGDRTGIGSPPDAAGEAQPAPPGETPPSGN